jgi:hypothetical protein
MAVKYFTGTPLDDPDPECVFKPEIEPVNDTLQLSPEHAATSWHASLVAGKEL